MGTLIESTFVTLDGAIDSPQRWSGPYWDEEHAGYARNLLFGADALLLGLAWSCSCIRNDTKGSR